MLRVVSCARALRQMGVTTCAPTSRAAAGALSSSVRGVILSTSSSPPSSSLEPRRSEEELGEMDELQQVEWYTAQQQQEQLQSSAAALDGSSSSTLAPSSSSGAPVVTTTSPSIRQDGISAEALAPLRIRAKQIMQSLAVSPHSEEIRELLKNAKTSREVRQIVEQFIVAHPFASDVLNGHGFRVASVVALTALAPKTNAMPEWFDLVERFRQFGFLVTRPHASEGSNMIKSWIQKKFQTEGRSPSMVGEAIDRIRQLMQWCVEDKVIVDHVLLARLISCAIHLVSFFDRQNVYRSNFSDAFSKRDAVVQEWAMCRERSVDYDKCVELCDLLVQDVLDMTRRYLPNTRLSFSYTYRLFDYYFATDNVAKMLELLAACERDGMDVAEAVTAKMMQLVCIFNYPNAMELFIRWRVGNPQSALAAPDATRLLFYFGRAGGGYACPKCGEKFNHRNSSLGVWKATPVEQRDCEYAFMARARRGDFDDLTDTPQAQDWSKQAFGIWDLCKDRGIRWGAHEWRNFLCCVMYSPSNRALEGLALLNENLPRSQFDDFLFATYCKVLRLHQPHTIVEVLEEWKESGAQFTPVVLQEAIIAAAFIKDDQQQLRVSSLTYCYDRIIGVDSYITAYTRRKIDRQTQRRQLKLQRNGGSALDEEELRIVERIGHLMPDVQGRLDAKDSIWDLVPLRQRKNVYIAHGKAAPAPKNQASKRNSPIGRY